MENGFLKVAVSSPDLKVADCQYNKEQLVKKTIEMDRECKAVSFSGVIADRIHLWRLVFTGYVAARRQRGAFCVCTGDKTDGNRRRSRYAVRA